MSDIEIKSYNTYHLPKWKLFWHKLKLIGYIIKSSHFFLVRVRKLNRLNQGIDVDFYQISPKVIIDFMKAVSDQIEQSENALSQAKKILGQEEE